jgi:magnesium transporter
MAKKKRRSVGLPPGTLVFRGQTRLQTTLLTLLEYNANEVREETGVTQINAIPADKTSWYDLRGLHQLDDIRKIGEPFKIHPLILEDIVDTEQRPKFEEYPNGFFVILRALLIHEESGQLETEQVALFCGKHLVLSFQEKDEDLFAPVRDRLLQAKGKIRQRGADYLTYALIDMIVDQYYVVLDQLEEDIDLLEEEILKGGGEEIKGKIHQQKVRILAFRKNVVPLREVINQLTRAESDNLDSTTLIFLRDLYDHVAQVIDTIDTYRELVHSLHDLYLSEISFRMNNIMKVLTIISTIFIPLSFLAGVYGMNFHYMPELSWKYGYFIILGVMFSVCIGLLFYFRRKKWL